MARILLLSAYDIDSHRRWREGLVSCLGEHQWVTLTLPPRYFRWRIRGNPISWSLTEHERLSQEYGAVLATSMVDCATLRGLYPQLAKCPWCLYFHENQLAYPISTGQHSSVDPAMVNIYSALACDTLIFNSDYNRKSFLTGLSELIAKLPDQIDQSLVAAIAEKSRVIPVPLEMSLLEPGSRIRRKQLTITWNHRVEYDKGLDKLRQILKLLQEQQAFDLILLGQRFRHQPAVWSQICEQFREHIVFNGYAGTNEEYRQWLRQSDVVLSTALHEFQGLAVMEASALGCVPVVPDRLSYPEYFADNYRYRSTAEAVRLIAGAREQKSPEMHLFGWDHLASYYRDLFN